MKSGPIGQVLIKDVYPCDPDVNDINAQYELKTDDDGITNFNAYAFLPFPFDEDLEVS